MSTEEIVMAANLYLTGESFRSLAPIYKVSHVTIKNNFSNKLKDIDYDLWTQVMEAIENKKLEKSLDNPVVQKRILKAYQLLTEKDLTVVEIAKELNSTEFTIYRDLKNRLEALHKISSDVVTKEMLEKVQKILTTHSANNRPVYLSLDKLFKKNSSKYTFLTRSILAFRLTLPTIKELFGYNEEFMQAKISELCQDYKHAYEYLFYYEYPNQEIAKKNFLDYYQKLNEAVARKNKEELDQLLLLITDKDFKEVRKRIIEKKESKPRDNQIILAYQLKYSYPSSLMAEYLDTSLNNYELRMNHLFAHNDLDQGRYEKLNEAWLKGNLMGGRK